MATTIPFPFREHHDILACDAKTNDLVDLLVQRYESYLRDSDKADTEHDLAYYEGVVDATVWVLLDILDVPDGDWDRYIDRIQPESNPAQ